MNGILSLCSRASSGQVCTQYALHSYCNKYGFMPNCYLCGRSLNASHTRLRRKVKTGEWIRRNYQRGGVEHVTHRFSSRVVCGGCAKKLDLRELKSDRWQKVQLFLWLAVLCLAAVLL